MILVAKKGKIGYTFLDGSRHTRTRGESQSRADAHTRTNKIRKGKRARTSEDTRERKDIKDMGDSSITVTDIFCGAGGFTTGAIAAGADVRFAANHWDRAIETHNTNYPNVDHFLADISIASPRKFPKTTGLIASPECTNHTLAKGKRRKHLNQGELFDDVLPDEAEERSRCTMWDPLKLAEVHDYQFVVLENVVDVRFWSEWESWVAAWESLNYVLQLVYLNSMFCHPTPQSRDRLYIVATKRKNRRPYLDIRLKAYCQQCAEDILAVQSWKNPMKKYGKYGKSGQYLYRCPQCTGVVQPYYYAAANAIDWTIPTKRIGDRVKPLEPKTIARIQLGLERFRGYTPFMTDVTKTSIRHQSVEQDPFPTQTARQTMALVEPPSPFVFSMNHAQLQGADVLQEAMPTRTTYDDTGFVTTPPFMVELHKNSTVRGIDEPLATFCAGGQHHALVTPPQQPFIIDHLHGYRPTSTENPMPTLCGMDHKSVVYPAWLMTYYSNGQLYPVTQPHSTVTTVDREALVTAGPNSGSGEDLDYEECGFRMLEPREIKAAMAFPKEYKVTGNRREQVKQLGNACTPPAIERIIGEVLKSLDG